MDRLNQPRPVQVQTDRQGRPVLVNGRKVESIIEDWLLEDQWWSATPARRRYWQVLTDNGAVITVFRDLVSGRWWRQNGH